MVVGQRLRVARDVGNPEDADACRVETLDGVQVGFVPRRLAARLAVSLPLPTCVTVDEVLVNGSVGLRVRVAAASGVSGEEQGSGRREVAGEADACGSPGTVRSLSGRVLGVMTGRGDGAVAFVDAQGASCVVPEHLVTVGPPDLQGL